MQWVQHVLFVKLLLAAFKMLLIIIKYKKMVYFHGGLLALNMNEIKPFGARLAIDNL